MTEFEYDDDGRLVRSVTTRDREWTEQDRAEALALKAYRSSFCPCGCGYPIADTTSHEETGPQFVAEKTICRARLALVEAQRALSDSDKKQSATVEARLWSVRMR